MVGPQWRRDWEWGVIMGTKQEVAYDDQEIERDAMEWQGFRNDWFVLFAGMPFVSGLIIAVAMGVGIYYGFT